jgi:hypothetical protein
MKRTLTLAAAALLASVSFAAAQSQQGQPAEEGQKAERNPSGQIGGTKQNPSPTMMQDQVSGPRAARRVESEVGAQSTRRNNRLGDQSVSARNHGVSGSRTEDRSAGERKPRG